MSNFNMNKVFNVKKSSRDERDYILEILVGANNLKSATICDYRKDLLKVRDQGEQGTCYAQSAACMKEWQEKKDYGLNEYLSPQFFYNNRSYWNDDKQDGDDINEDNGMTGRDVMRILKEIGICKESEYPYFKIEKANEIPQEIYASASRNKISSYARIYSIEGLKHSLLDNGPCLITFPVYNYGKEMWIQKKEEDMFGGHAMTVVGFDDIEKHFIIRNSWGSNWCDKGYCYYKYDDWGSHWEIWTTIDIRSSLENLEDEIIDSSDSNKESIDTNDLSDNSEEEVKKSCWERFKKFILN